MREAAPLRFLAVVVLGWVGLRAVILAPSWLRDEAPGVLPLIAVANATPVPTYVADILPPTAAPRSRERVPTSPHPLRIIPVSRLGASPATPAPPPRAADPFARFGQSAPEMVAVPPLVPMTPESRRWSVSAWLLVRSESNAPSFAAGGSLGGSQAGGRLLYRLSRSLALSGRLYVPLHRPGGAEVAGGLDWQPSSAAAVHLLAERRQAVARDGRSAFSLTAYGSVSRNLPGRLQLDAYAQAGLVGARARDAFADGAVRLSRPLGPLDVGAGAWAAAQPRAARLDAGPTLSLRLPALHARLEADWRFRLAGAATPASGPALVLAADF